MTLQRTARGGFAKTQRGGFAIGLVVGLLIGLALALGVALYVTKVPVPFVNKVPQRTAGQDAAEAEKNKNWDPNSPLYGKNPAVKAASGVAAGPAPVVPPVVTGPASAAAPLAKASAPAPTPRDPAVLLGGGTASAPAPRVAAAAAANPGADPFSYFVQAGAYGKTEDAEQQRARLAMMGMEARLTEREQSGRTVFRVRLGPFDKRDDAEAAKSRLGDAGIESALVRVQR